VLIPGNNPFLSGVEVQTGLAKGEMPIPPGAGPEGARFEKLLSQEFEAGLRKDLDEKNREEIQGAPSLLLVPNLPLPVMPVTTATAQEINSDLSSVAPAPSQSSKTMSPSLRPNLETPLQSVKQRVVLPENDSKPLQKVGTPLSGAAPEMSLPVGATETSIEVPVELPFSVEGLKVSDSSARDSRDGPEQPDEVVPAPKNHAWSTDAFLGLRGITRSQDGQSEAGLGSRSSEREIQKVARRGGPTGPDAVMPFQSPVNSSGAQINSSAIPVEAHVVRTPSGKATLHPESVGALTHQVGLLSQARQDGEIKIRLKPDHLGELVMNVRTRGKEVAIEIKAADKESKKILEDSISSLRDSLSQQNLSLSRVEVLNVPTTQNPDTSAQLDPGAGRQDLGGGMSGQSGREGERGDRQERLFEEAPQSLNLKPSLAGRSIRSNGRTGLDLIA
jgi:flagellar hook-length control protein FliK